MTALHKKRIDAINGYGDPILDTGELNQHGRRIVEPLDAAGSFTRSNGTLFARIYERLTKASRRDERAITGFIGTEDGEIDRAYRRGVKDTLEALRSELS